MASYGNDAIQTYDVLTPSPGPTTTGKAIVYIHGGGWRTLDKSNYTTTAQLIANTTNLKVYNINYNIDQFGCLHGYADCAAAVAYVKALESTSKVVAWGDSAGGHLSLLLAARGLVVGGVAWSPMVNPFTWSYGYTSLATDILCPVGKCPDAWKYFSPYHQLTTSSSPTYVSTYDVDPYNLDSSHAQPFVDKSILKAVFSHVTVATGDGVTLHGVNLNTLAEAAVYALTFAA